MEDKIRICVLLTTYNRAETTIRALNSIDDENLTIDYLIVDDMSTDGTRAAIREWNGEDIMDAGSAAGETGIGEEEPQRKSKGNLRIIKGSGSLYWAGGMRLGMKTLLELDKNAGKVIESDEKGKALRINAYDYLLLINDDVEFYPGIIMKMIERSKTKGDMPVTGATCERRKAKADETDDNTSRSHSEDSSSHITYGGVLYDMKKAKPRQIDISEADKTPVDTMNCNAFLLPWEIFRKAGAFDKMYIHSLADYDYGFRLKNMGYKVWLTDFYVGECNDNEIKGTWRDSTLHRLKRLKLKEAVKGLPRKQWYYYLRKNFGLRQAVWHSITPYLRILGGV